MSNENDREIKTEKIVSSSNTPVEQRSYEERSSSTVTTDSGSTGLIIGLVLALAAGLGATMYFLNNRPTVPVVVPGATNTIKENKSTVIERNNTTVKESAPSIPQPAPNVEVNVPAQPAPNVNVNIPAAPSQPVTPDPVPAN